MAATERQITILADSWYSNKLFVSYIKGTEAKFQLDCRKNLRMQIADRQAIKNKNNQTRGRKQTKYHTYQQLQDYLVKTTNWHSFADKKTRQKIKYKKRTVTLKTIGRVTIYAF